MKLNITGFISGVLFFSYSFLACAVYGLLTGTVGFLTAYAFVRRIYGFVSLHPNRQLYSNVSLGPLRSTDGDFGTVYGDWAGKGALGDTSDASTTSRCTSVVSGRPPGIPAAFIDWQSRPKTRHLSSIYTTCTRHQVGPQSRPVSCELLAAILLSVIRMAGRKETVRNVEKIYEWLVF